MIAAGDEHWIACPTSARVVSNPAVLVPSPGLIYQNESMACVAKPELELAADRRRDAIVRNGRVAIMANANHTLANFCFAQCLKEMIERVARGIFYLPWSRINVADTRRAVSHHAA
jgi:hypothetical protein